MSVNVHHLNGNLLVGSSHFYVDTLTNKVGITTTTPDAGLHVNSNAYVNTDFRVGADIAMNVTSGRITAGSFEGDGSLLSGINSDSGSWVKDDANSKIYVSNTNHRVGIGTASPRALLDVSGPVDVPAILTSGATASEGDIAVISGEALQIGHWDSGTSTFTNRIHINGSGNVGIGTSTPQQKLEVHGNILLGQNNVESFIHGGSTTVFSSDADVLIVADANDTSGAIGSNSIIFGAGSATDTDDRDFTYAQAYPNDVPRVELMRITGSGSLGLGIASPDHKLHIYDDSTDPVYLKIQGQGSDRAGIVLSEDSSDILVMEYDGTGADAGNYLAFYSKYSNWAAKGTGLNFIPQNGRVGINTTSPESALHVNGSITVGDIGADPGLTYQDAQLILGGTHNTGYNRGNYVKLLITGANNDGSSPYEILCEDENGFETFFLKGPVNHNGVDGILYMKGKVGIGIQSPDAYFHVFRDSSALGENSDQDTHLKVGTAGEVTIERKSGSTLIAKLYSNMSSSRPKWIYYHSSSSYWQVGQAYTSISGSTYNDFKFFWINDTKAYIDASDGSVEINFTGQHRTFIDGVPTSESGDFVGLIVSANKNKYMKMSKGVEMGSNAITINEALPLVSLSTVTHDKACFGVISDAEDPETRKDSFGNLITVSNKEKGDTRVYINSVGEGAIWVTNINGPLESGDYITTSNVAGYGQKQDDDVLHNYTVAKITMDCDFDPVTQPVQIIKKEMGEVNYWVNTTYENVSEEEYSNLAHENRRIVDGIYQEIIKLESKTEEEGYELEVRRELVNVLDEHGQLQWEDSGETEKAYKVRYLLPDGTQISEEQYTAKALANEEVYIAAFVGCTYHCG